MTGMAPRDDRVHTASAVIDVAPRQAFTFLADGISLGRWALGCFETKAMGDGVFAGRSLFDGRALYVRIEPSEGELAVTYRVGSQPDRLSPRISAKVSPLEPGSSECERCLVSLIAERTPDMSDERWRQLAVTHETEILLIKGQLERMAEGTNANGARS
jgi:hypothetical protein